MSGFKSIRDEQSIDIKNLTILAGANSSGKSSMMQPLLLLKQTLEAPFDPGPLLLNGPNVKFTKAEQLLARFGEEQAQEFKLGFMINENQYEAIYCREPQRGFQIKSCTMIDDVSSRKISLTYNMTGKQIRKIVDNQVSKDLERYIQESEKNKILWKVIRNRCFYDLIFMDEITELGHFGFALFALILRILEEGIIHLPGVRGNPERNYPLSAIGNKFPGTFEVYTSSIIAQWQEGGEKERIKQLSHDLERLGLTWTIEAHRINDAQVELSVGRLPKDAKGGSKDLVNITDVGFGVSQSLPVLTALYSANRGQIVYIDQPELHLHPRAQVVMAGVLADAAKRGVKLIIETHSKMLLLGIQTLIAEGNLSPDLVSLNWFERDREGVTHITQGQLDEYGRFGDWPEDFDDVSLNAESRYLDAIDKRMAG